MIAKDFKEQFRRFLYDRDFNYIFNIYTLEIYHEKVCNEMKQKIAKELAIVNIDEVDNIEF